MGFVAKKRQNHLFQKSPNLAKSKSHGALGPTFFAFLASFLHKKQSLPTGKNFIFNFSLKKDIFTRCSIFRRTDGGNQKIIVWSMTVRPKTIIMMSIPICFHPKVFVGGFRVDQYLTNMRSDRRTDKHTLFCN